MATIRFQRRQAARDAKAKALRLRLADARAYFEGSGKPTRRQAKSMSKPLKGERSFFRGKVSYEQPFGTLYAMGGDR